MDPLVLVPAAVAVVALLVVSAFFSSSESAIFSLPAASGRDEADDSPEGVALRELRADPHRLLVTLLVGNNLVNIAISSIVTTVVATVFPPGVAVVLATLAATVLVLVFGEIVPKSYGLGHAETWSRRVDRPLVLVERALGPLVTVFDAGTEWLTRAVGGDGAIEEPYLDDPP